MKDQVNLYQARFWPETLGLSGLRVLQVTTAILAVLGLLQGYAQWSVWSQSHRLDSLRERHADEANHILELAKTHPPAQPDSALVAEVEALTVERDAKTRLVRALARQSFGNTEGFSQHIAGLARQHVSGLWLRAVRIRRGGRELALAGSTLDPELVPRFIQQLGREPVFAGADFSSLRLQRSEEDPGRIDFSLGTDGTTRP